MSMAMIVKHLAPQDFAGLGAAGIDELRWLKPVHPGDVLRCESEIVALTPSRSKPAIGTVRTRTTVFNH
jgi:acyl dehydratase